MATTASALDVLVIGAGQAGLALGFHLKATGQHFLVVDRHDRIGESWRKRFDSLTLFTPRAYSALPGLPVPGDPQGYPTKDEIADYLESYARHFALPVKLDKRARDDGFSYRIERPAGVRVGTGGPTFTFASLNGDVRILKNK